MQTFPFVVFASAGGEKWIQKFIKLYQKKKSKVLSQLVFASQVPRIFAKLVMGKKRKTAGSSREEAPAGKTADFRSKFDFEDTFEDSEDEFQASRDHILLDEGPEAKRQRKLMQQGLRNL